MMMGCKKGEASEAERNEVMDYLLAMMLELWKGRRMDHRGGAEMARRNGCVLETMTEFWKGRTIDTVLEVARPWAWGNFAVTVVYCRRIGPWMELEMVFPWEYLWVRARLQLWMGSVRKIVTETATDCSKDRPNVDTSAIQIPRGYRMDHLTLKSCTDVWREHAQYSAVIEVWYNTILVSMKSKHVFLMKED